MTPESQLSAPHTQGPSLTLGCGSALKVGFLLPNALSSDIISSFPGRDCGGHLVHPPASRQTLSPLVGGPALLYLALILAQPLAWQQQTVAPPWSSNALGLGQTS